MIRLSKSVLAVGGVFLTAGLIAFANPKTVHAVAAALVQVSNTASNPAVVQGIGKQAAQIVEISCGDTPAAAGHGGDCTLENDFGLQGGPTFYIVPSGQTLVIDSVDITTGIGAQSPCMSPAFVQLLVVDPSAALNESSRDSWLVPGGVGTAHYVYPSGIVVAGGTYVFGLGTTSACSVGVQLRGYLTAQ
jgi:hypothetical protein